MTWQYKVREAETHSRSAHELEDELNKLGAQDWLLVTEHNEKLIFVRPAAPPTPPQAVSGRVSVVPSTNSQGEPMALTVDAAGVAKFQFDDDKGDVNIAPPTGDSSGLVVTFASDNPAVVSGYDAAVQGQDANGNPEWTANPTVVADGTFNLSAEVTQVSGAPLVDDDGTTPFVQPQAVAVTLAGGQATTGTVSEG